jgi:predicted RNA-binding protein YlxR (DUF448 family)/ribosomal protein L30E
LVRKRGGRRLTEPQGDAAEDQAEPPEESGPLRRCLVTGLVLPVERLVRFVVGPEGDVVPDVEARLPGRGLWLSAERDVVNTASAKNLFAKAARRKALPPSELTDRVEGLLSRRCLDLIGLARRAGQAIAGFEKVRSALKAGQGAVLLAASDGAADGREKVKSLAPALPIIALFDAGELGAAFGRDHVVHGVITPGRLAERLLVEAGRLAGFRR